MRIRRALLTTLLLMLTGVRPAAAHNPAVSVSPGSGPPGASVTVNATGYDPNQNATVVWDYEDIGSMTLDENGHGAPHRPPQLHAARQPDGHPLSPP